MNRLPNPLCTWAFSFLDFREHAVVVSCCKRWRTLAHRPASFAEWLAIPPAFFQFATSRSDAYELLLRMAASRNILRNVSRHVQHLHICLARPRDKAGTVLLLNDFLDQVQSFARLQTLSISYDCGTDDAGGTLNDKNKAWTLFAPCMPCPWLLQELHLDRINIRKSWFWHLLTQTNIAIVRLSECGFTITGQDKDNAQIMRAAKSDASLPKSPPTAQLKELELNQCFTIASWFALLVSQEHLTAPYLSSFREWQFMSRYTIFPANHVLNVLQKLPNLARYVGAFHEWQRLDFAPLKSLQHLELHFARVPSSFASLPDRLQTLHLRYVPLSWPPLDIPVKLLIKTRKRLPHGCQMTFECRACD